MPKAMIVFEDQYNRRHIEFPTPKPDYEDDAALEKRARAIARSGSKIGIARQTALMEAMLRHLLEDHVFGSVDYTDNLNDSDIYHTLRALGFTVEFEEGQVKVEKRNV